jgi:hypothetical protein
VYDPAAFAEISLVGPGADLRRASEAYCETARSKGLASGESSLGGIAERFLGTGVVDTPYAQKLGVGKVPPEQLITQVRADAKEIVTGLEALNRLAAKVAAEGSPSSTDVNQLEVALIHAGQARESIASALGKMNQAGTKYDAAVELKPLDGVLVKSRKLADDLATAHAKADADASVS